MRFAELEAEWDEDNLEHIARHGVEPDEVEEIVYEDCHRSWIVRARRRTVPEVRWAVFGQTCGGRNLVAVIAPYPQRRVWRAGNGDRHGNANSTEVSAVAQKLTVAQRRALREEAQAWDELPDEAFARLFDDGKPVQIRVRRPPPKTLTVALDTATLNRLRREARRKQVAPRHLAALWIAERLREEKPAAGKRRSTD